MGNGNVHDLDRRLDSCLIGWDAEVTSKNGHPKADSMYIGDNSIVQISK